MIAKWVLKMWITIDKRHFVIFLDTAHSKVKSHKKADSEASAKWKDVKGKSDKINELTLKTKGDLKEGPDNI